MFLYFTTTYGASVAGLCTTKHNNAQLIPVKLRKVFIEPGRFAFAATH